VGYDIACFMNVSQSVLFCIQWRNFLSFFLWFSIFECRFSLQKFTLYKVM